MESLNSHFKQTKILMSQTKVNLTNNQPLFKLIFNLGDYSQLKEFHENL